MSVNKFTFMTGSQEEDAIEAYNARQNELSIF